MSNHLIAIVEDDDNIRQIVEAYLQKDGYRTAGVGSAEEAFRLWREASPDLWILDIMLPGMSGYDFCRQIRQEAEVPIIFLSARDEEVDRILGLELGSDDYMTKPFSPRELVARVKRQLARWDAIRRYQVQSASAGEGTDTAYVQHGELRVLIEERRVFWRGDEVDVTVKEYDLLKLLVDKPNRAFSREELLTLVWGDDYFGSDRAVDDLVKRLRKKMEGIPVETVWGYGYRLRAEGVPER